MSPFERSGYDAAQARRENDDLDRWRFAADIVDVVLSTPQEWSVRMGVFGKWGEGKSTVLQFAEQMLKQKGSITFWFNPWAVQNWDDLWTEFSGCLFEALQDADIPFENPWKKLGQKVKKLKSSSAGSATEAAAAIFGKDRALEAGFRAVSRWLTYDGAQIRAIQKDLQGRRLVVLIDDLDRCDPKLIPQLLLSLRELLDLPGFTFLLAFDEDIVGRALAEKNPAWLGGSDFLEKILDFRFHIPTITDAQKEKLICKALATYCSFVPSESTAQIKDLLPNNPRKLKAIIRSLAALQPQIARHDLDELNWVDIWLAQMLRLESNSFFERLLEGDMLDKEAGTLYEILSGKNKGEKRNQSLKQLIDQSGVKDSTTVDRLVKLIEAIRSRSSLRFRYACELVVRPHAITWKEFRAFYAKWIANPKIPTLLTWIQEHSKKRGVSIEDVENELFATILTRRNGCLEDAAQATTTEEHDSCAKEADLLLDLIEQDLVGLDHFGSVRFTKIYGQFSSWIGFCKNLSDEALRSHEKALLINLLHSASDSLSSELLEVVSPANPYPDFGEVIPEKQSLRATCLAIVAPKAAKAAITFLTRRGGIQNLSERGRYAGVKYCLFHPESPVWNTEIRDELFELIRRGKEDSVIYENSRNLFELLMRGLEQGTDSASPQDIARILADREFVRCIWATVISKAIQYRMQTAFIKSRQSLIRNGIPENSLPLTNELKMRIEQDETQAGVQANKSQVASEPAILQEPPLDPPELK